MMKDPIEGTKLITDPDTGLPPSLSEVMIEIEGPTETPYAERYFTIKLVIPSDFPTSPPRGFFLTKIFHPNVDISTGAICVNTLKKDWNHTVTISHVLKVIRCLLIVPYPESSLNDEAGKLFMDSYDEYARRAKLMANVHAKTNIQVPVLSNSDCALKHLKENKYESMIHNVKNTSVISSSAVLKQSNSADRNVVEGVTKKARSSSTNSKTGEKRYKKKNLKRL